MPERFHDWTLRQRAIYRKLWLEEVMSQLGPGPGSGVYRRIWLEEVMAQARSRARPRGRALR